MLSVYLFLSSCQREPELPSAPNYTSSKFTLVDTIVIPLSDVPFSIAALKQVGMTGNSLWLVGTGQSPYGAWDSFLYGPLFSPDDSATVLFSRAIPRYRRGFNGFQMVDRAIMLFGNAVVLESDVDLNVQQQVFLDRPDTLSLSGTGLSKVVLPEKNGFRKYIIGVKNMRAGFSGARFSRTPGAYAMYDDKGTLETFFGRYPDLYFEPGHILSDELSAVTYHDDRIYVTHLGEEAIHEYNLSGKEIRSYPFPSSKVFDPTLQYVSSKQLPTGNPSENPSMIDTVKKYSTHFISGFAVDNSAIHLVVVDRRFKDGRQQHKTIYRRWDLANRKYVEHILPVPAHTHGQLAKVGEDTVQVAYLDRANKKIQVDVYRINLD